MASRVQADKNVTRPVTTTSSAQPTINDVNPMQPQQAPAIPPRTGVNPVTCAQTQSSPAVSRSTGPQLPPRTSKNPVSIDPLSSVPPPRPPKSSAPPLPSRSPPAQRSTDPPRSMMYPTQAPSLDENIARLMEMGYSFDDVNRALAISQNKLNVAAQILQNFVPTFT